jgi:septum formation protein
MMNSNIEIQPIVLASASPRRKALFEELQIPFIQMPSHIDEIRNPGEAPLDFALRAALEKGEDVALKLAARGETPWIVSADTIVVLGDEVFFKPKDVDDARNMMRRLSGRTHTVVTGFAVGGTGRDWRVSHAETDVTFHLLKESQIERYVQTGEGLDKAGAYAVQGLGTFLVERIDGNYFNVVGLPVSLVVRTLIEVGALPDFPLI